MTHEATSEAPTAPTPTTDTKPAVDWSKVKPEDIPRQLIDKHPRVRELVETRKQLANDLRLTHKAYLRAAQLGSAIHTIVQGLEDTDQLLGGTVSEVGRSVLAGVQQPPTKRDD